MPNCSMRHQNPVGDFDDTGHFLQGALCTIAALLLNLVLNLVLSILDLCIRSKV
jgi:hypothetical protein